MTTTTVGENDESVLLAHFRNAAAQDLQELALLQDCELTPALLEEVKKVDFPANLGVRLQTDVGKEADDFMRKAVTELPTPFTKELMDDLAVDFSAIYLNNSLHASPYESVWLTDDGLTRQEPMFQVRRWYEKYDLAAENWQKRPDDHLVLQMQFLSHLLSLDDRTETLREAAQFLDEHLLRWISLFASRVATRCDTAFYAGVVVLTAQYLEELRESLAQLLGEPRPSTEEIDQRMKSPVEATEVKFCSPGPVDEPLDLEMDLDRS